MGSMLFTIMAARAQMELEIKQEGVVDSIAKRREAGKDLGGRPQLITHDTSAMPVDLLTSRRLQQRFPAILDCLEQLSTAERRH